MAAAAVSRAPPAVEDNNTTAKSITPSLPGWSLVSLLGSAAWRAAYRALAAGNKQYGGAFLEGNFAPVDEERYAPALPVEAGALPPELDGAFLRIGPNPALPPVGGYHWFDGDGMVHAVRIKNGAASYCNRWVDTARLRSERRAGFAHVLKLGDHVGPRGLALLLLNRLRHAVGLLDTSQGLGTANTAMVAHAGRLLALNEGDLPYALRLACTGVLETVGRVALPGWGLRSFTAHPKLDPETGKLYFFRYTFDAKPYATAGVLDAAGSVEASVPLDLPRPVMMHDMAISKSYAIFMDLPLVFDGERMVKGGLPFRFAPEHGARIGLLPKGATDAAALRWFDLPAFMAFHVANAWEEDDGTVKLFLCAHETISLDLDTRTTATGTIPEGERPKMAVVTVDPATGAASLRRLSEAVGDFPTVHPGRVGLKCRYAYVASMVTGSRAVKWDGVAKIDLQAPDGADACVGRITLPPGHHNGETVFVPRYEEPERCAAEDDGFLLTYAHDERAGASYLAVFDAATMDSKPLAKVALPARVPYGFHALWVGAGALRAQYARAGLEAMFAGRAEGSSNGNGAAAAAR